MKRLFTLAALSMLVVASTASMAEAKTWVGIWDRNQAWSSTLTFQSGNRVKYCFLAECTVAKYVGDPDGTIRFNWGGASFTFKWKGNGYRATRRSGSTRNSGFFKQLQAHERA